MKVTELIGAAVVLSMVSATKGSVLDVFFDNGNSDETEIIFPEGAGLFLNEEEFELGKKGFQCLEDFAGVEKEAGWGQNLIRPISRAILQAYGENGINTICGSQLLARVRLQKAARSGNSTRRERNRSLRMAAPAGDATMPDRRTQEQSLCASWPARYAGGGAVYSGFARDHLDIYLNNGDQTKRTSAVKTFSLQEEMNTVRQAAAILARCSQLWSSINQFISIPDVPAVEQAAISEAIKTFVCELPLTYTDVAMMRLNREQELLNFHDELVRGAEVGAMYQNTKTLMAKLCERDSQMTRLLEDIDAIKNTVDRM